MAPNSRKNNLVFKAEKPHFFKIILHDSVREHKLAIPRKFARTCGHCLPNPVMLKVPSGAKWKVGVVESDGIIFLQNGWKEFADYYSVAFGTFLVFQYDKKNCEFDVVIFDPSCSEIDYPFCITNEDNNNERDDLGKHFQQPNTVHEDEMKVRSSILNPQKCAVGQVEGKGKQSIEKEQKLSSPNHHEAKSAAKNFTSQNQSFQARISSDCLNRRRIVLCKTFFKNMKKGTQAIMLQFNNKLWPVNLLIYPKSGKGVLSAGWSQFLRENGLKFGDVCTFKIINSIDQTPLVKVSITRASGEMKAKPYPSFFNESFNDITGENPNTQAEQENGSQTDKEQMANKSNMTSCFKVVMTSSNLQGSRVYLPINFIRNLKLKTQNAKLKVDGRFWSVKLNIFPEYGFVSVSEGWLDFVRKSGLKVGNDCLFRLIDDQNLVIKVSISRSMSSN